MRLSARQFRSLAFIAATTLLATCTFLTPAPAGAQTLRFQRPTVDCNVLERRYDNPFSDHHGYVQPRLAWHAEYAAGSMAIGYALHRWAHFPPWAAAATATIGIGLAPHVRGYLRGAYAINPADWAFDLWNRATPTFWAIAHRHDDSSSGIHWRRHATATGTWILGYAALACFASP